ncbi:MAG: sigma-54-dependent Fis family transcriptional regulator [Rhodanobacteraceae bacterium]|nr:sigma-54-dependent Fis family transcriptional regulator [Rhodanobacteraceae bacterium]
MTDLPILIADDQRDVLEALRFLLKAEGMPSLQAMHPDAVIETLRKQPVAVVLMDLNYTRDTTSGQEGLDLLERIRALDAELPVVVMTAWGTIDIAVEAMRRGANDFVEKPWDNTRLIAILRNQAALGASRRRNRRLEREIEILRGTEDGEFVAESAAMRPVLDMIQRVGPTEANILILGENGTGKGLIADLIHRNSRRADKTLIKVNMGGIAESVFESEMFGHVRGAFTDAKQDRIGRFELADGGTLFLDEVGNIPVSQQPKLLRVLEDGEFERLGSSRTSRANVRLISATNADLADDVAKGRFRKDLMFRLNTVELRLPALRERREDILPLARRLLTRFGQRYQRESVRLSAAAERALLGYAWPGNVRELSHVIERAVLMSRADEIGDLDFSFAPTRQSDSELDHLTLDAAEEMLVRRAMIRAEGNVQRASDLLGLSRAALYRRLEKYGIRSPGESEGE